MIRLITVNNLIIELNSNTFAQVVSQCVTPTSQIGVLILYLQHILIIIIFYQQDFYNKYFDFHQQQQRSTLSLRVMSSSSYLNIIQVSGLLFLTPLGNF